MTQAISHSPAISTISMLRHVSCAREYIRMGRRGLQCTLVYGKQKLLLQELPIDSEGREEVVPHHAGTGRGT